MDDRPGGRGRALQRAHSGKCLRRCREGDTSFSTARSGLGAARPACPPSACGRSRRTASAHDARGDREILELALSTVSLWLKRMGSASARASIPRAAQPYERRTPVSSSTSTSGSSAAYPIAAPDTACSGTREASTLPQSGPSYAFTGYEYVHVAVDHSRLAYADVLEDLTARSAVAFLRRAVTWFPSEGCRCARS